MEESKRVSDSAMVLCHVMMPANANHYGYVHGGTILQLVDEAAYAVASRHTRKNVVTASLDHMVFEAPVRVGDVIILKASVNYVGKTSMEVGVRVETEKLKEGVRLKVGSAYLTMVALDENGRPTPVPRLIPETEEEKRRHREAEERRRRRLDAKI